MGRVGSSPCVPARDSDKSKTMLALTTRGTNTLCSGLFLVNTADAFTIAKGVQYGYKRNKYIITLKRSDRQIWTTTCTVTNNVIYVLIFQKLIKIFNSYFHSLFIHVQLPVMLVRVEVYLDKRL